MTDRLKEALVYILTFLALFTIIAIPILVGGIICAYAQQCSEDTQVARLTPAMVGGVPAAAACSPEITDLFNRANSTNLGTDWTEEVATEMAIASNTLAGDFSGGVRTARHNTATDSITQYVKVKFVEVGADTDNGACVVLRSSAVDGYRYLVCVLYDGTLSWYVRNWNTYEATITSTAAGAVADGNTLGMTIQGTGNDTILNIWVWTTTPPTNNCPYDANNWDSASDGPDYNWINNPPGGVGTYCDSGTRVGLMFAGSDASPDLAFDDFYAGGL